MPANLRHTVASRYSRYAICEMDVSHASIMMRAFSLVAYTATVDYGHENHHLRTKHS